MDTNGIFVNNKGYPLCDILKAGIPLGTCLCRQDSVVLTLAMTCLYMFKSNSPLNICPRKKWGFSVQHVANLSAICSKAPFIVSDNLLHLNSSASVASHDTFYAQSSPRLKDWLFDAVIIEFTLQKNTLNAIWLQILCQRIKLWHFFFSRS